jgi:hypothetical protein
MRETVDSLTTRTCDAKYLGNNLAVGGELRPISIRVYLQLARHSAWATAGPFMVRIVEGSDLAGGSSNRGGI